MFSHVQNLAKSGHIDKTYSLLIQMREDRSVFYFYGGEVLDLEKFITAFPLLGILGLIVHYYILPFQNRCVFKADHINNHSLCVDRPGFLSG